MVRDIIDSATLCIGPRIGFGWVRQILPRIRVVRSFCEAQVLNVDETGHRTKGATRWLWTLVAPTCVFSTIATSRGAKVLSNLLGTRFTGVLCRDRLQTSLS
jgi:hypothetical protein